MTLEVKATKARLANQTTLREAAEQRTEMLLDESANFVRQAEQAEQRAIEKSQHEEYTTTALRKELEASHNHTLDVSMRLRQQKEELAQHNEEAKAAQAQLKSHKAE